MLTLDSLDNIKSLIHFVIYEKLAILLLYIRINIPPLVVIYVV